MFDRYPELKLIASHLGGMILCYLDRLNWREGNPLCQEEPEVYFKKIMKLVNTLFSIKNISCRLTHLLRSDVGQMEFSIVRFMVSPHHKNLEPLGPQGAQRLRMIVTFVLFRPR